MNITRTSLVYLPSTISNLSDPIPNLQPQSKPDSRTHVIMRDVVGIIRCIDESVRSLLLDKRLVSVYLKCIGMQLQSGQILLSFTLYVAFPILIG